MNIFVTRPLLQKKEDVQQKLHFVMHEQHENKTKVDANKGTPARRVRQRAQAAVVRPEKSLRLPTTIMRVRD